MQSDGGNNCNVFAMTHMYDPYLLSYKALDNVTLSEEDEFQSVYILTLIS